MKKIFLILFYLAFFIFSVCSETHDKVDFLSGNWYKNSNPEKTVLREFSWGKGVTVINFAVEIDLTGNDKSIHLPMIGGPFKVTEVKAVNDNLLSLTFFFDRGGFDVTYHVHKVDDGIIWFELITEKNLTFIPTGADFLWYKIDGPDM